jgi:hypothetical protein
MSWSVLEEDVIRLYTDYCYNKKLVGRKLIAGQDKSPGFFCEEKRS